MSSTIPGRTSGFVQLGPNTDMRSFVAASVMLASLACAGAATAAECPPGAMGVSRTIVVDPAEHQLLGSQQYRESLPLRDKEVADVKHIGYRRNQPLTRRKNTDNRRNAEHDSCPA